MRSARYLVFVPEKTLKGLASLMVVLCFNTNGWLKHGAKIRLFSNPVNF
jgi:hypothetical protein